MKFYGQQALILTFTLAFFSCENNITISKQLSHFDPKIHLSILDKNEKLPAGVREFLMQQTVSSEAIPKFPVSYYLIQAEDAKFLRTKEFNSQISDQLVYLVSGEKYYKLFVHPDSDKIYSFLKHGYRYIGPNETEFMGSPVAGNKTLVVWSARNLLKTPFIVKTVLDSETIQQISSRFPATATIGKPEMINLIFKRKIRGSTEKIEGQQITEVPKL